MSSYRPFCPTKSSELSTNLSTPPFDHGWIEFSGGHTSRLTCVQSHDATSSCPQPRNASKCISVDAMLHEQIAIDCTIELWKHDIYIGYHRYTLQHTDLTHRQGHVFILQPKHHLGVSMSHPLGPVVLTRTGFCCPCTTLSQGDNMCPVKPGTCSSLISSHP